MKTYQYNRWQLKPNQPQLNPESRTKERNKNVSIKRFSCHLKLPLLRQMLSRINPGAQI